MPSPDIHPYTCSPLNVGYRVTRGRLERTSAEPPRRKVAICGSAGVRDLPFEDPQFELWGMNNFWNTMRDRHGRLRADRWWEMHQIYPDTTGPDCGRSIQDANDMRWIRECLVPLYTTQPFPENPRALIWPIGDFAARYRDYFTCTFAMQIVQAYDEGFEELHVYGLELLLGTKREATVESSCVNYWLGFVEGRGMKVVLAPASDGDPQLILAHPFRYGHDYWLERRWVEEYTQRWDYLPTAI